MLPTSLWKDSTSQELYPRLAGNLHVDVAVIGGGIAGVTAALFLQRAGEKVALLEAFRLGAGETGKTTAHLTELLDTPYRDIESKFGRERACLVAESARAAIQRIQSLASELGGARFERVPAYVYAETAAQRRELEREIQSLQRVGARAIWVDQPPLPFSVQGAVRVDAQAQFHPLEYVRAVARELARVGGHIYEQTRVLGMSDGEPCRLKPEHGVVTARYVLVLANVPVNNRVALHTKLAAYRSYAIAMPLPSSESFPPGLFYDMQDPYHYVRKQSTDRGTFLIVGGADHKTGQEQHTDDCYRRLSQFSRQKLGMNGAEYRWSGQIIEPADGLPFIGNDPGSKHVYVATGFSGTGMTFGTLSAMLLRDAVVGVENPWARLYAASRFRPLAQAKSYVSENVDYPACLLRDRLSRGEANSMHDVMPGEGRLVRDHGRMLAVYRDHDGRIHSRSAVCTHMGCLVGWNDAERTWDCPCHGSRFTTDGDVISGPAEKPLSEVDA